MNQILINNKSKKINKLNKRNESKRIKKIFKYKVIIIISIIITLVSCIYYYVFYYINNKDKITFSILNIYNLKRLYKKEKNYSTIYLNNNKNFFIIGTIEIPSININYPIISNTTDEYLKIAPCRFYGPYPNQIGNLCIAAHNYNDNRFFSNIINLNLENEIIIYDSNNQKTSYYVYKKYELNINDYSCTSQKTNNKKEITLVTCNNLNGNRIIIKAKE